ncbi:MAG: phage virion morphogenesis protein [Chloroflexi bacterium]|nr:phage virion morphogenesis protein [Chloroflexota bacterium]
MITSKIDDRDAQRMLRGIVRRAQDATPAMQRIRHVVEQEWREAFETSGASLGERWQELKPATKAARRRMRGGNKDASKVLWARGDLRRSLVQQSTDSIVEVGPQHLRRGTADRKAAAHHTGTRDGRLPARPLITDTMTARVGRRAAEILAAHVAGRPL